MTEVKPRLVVGVFCHSRLPFRADKYATLYMIYGTPCITCELNIVAISLIMHAHNDMRMYRPPLLRAHVFFSLQCTFITGSAVALHCCKAHAEINRKVENSTHRRRQPYSRGSTCCPIICTGPAPNVKCCPIFGMGLNINRHEIINYK